MPAESPDKLIAAIDGLAGEVRMLRDVMEEFRVCFEWAVQNDRFGCRSADEPFPPRSPAGAGTREEAQEGDGQVVALQVSEKLAALTLVVEEMRGVLNRSVPKAQRTLFLGEEPGKR